MREETKKAKGVGHQFVNKLASTYCEKNHLKGPDYNVVENLDKPNEYFVSSKNGSNSYRDLSKVNSIVSSKDPKKQEEYVVYLNLESKRCLCNCPAYGMHGIACKHIFAICQFLKRENIWEEEEYRQMFVHPCYFKNNLSSAYSRAIKPVHGGADTECSLGPPIVTVKSVIGKRIASTFARHQPNPTGAQAPNRCSRCKQLGHKVTACKLIDLTLEEIEQAAQDSSLERRLKFYHISLEPNEDNPLYQGDILDGIPVVEPSSNTASASTDVADTSIAPQDSSISNNNEATGHDDNINALEDNDAESNISDDVNSRNVATNICMRWKEALISYVDYFANYLTSHELKDQEEIVFSIDKSNFDYHERINLQDSEDELSDNEEIYGDA